LFKFNCFVRIECVNAKQKLNIPDSSQNIHAVHPPVERLQLSLFTSSQFAAFFLAPVCLWSGIRRLLIACASWNRETWSPAHCPVLIQPPYIKMNEYPLFVGKKFRKCNFLAFKRASYFTNYATDYCCLKLVCLAI
jgi:hypothetical protein